jgi:hypothetical protein
MIVPSGLTEQAWVIFTLYLFVYSIDDASAAAYIFAISTYAAVTIPSLRTIVEPVPNVDTLEDRIEALRVLSAGNTIIIVLLGIILSLQVRENMWMVWVMLISAQAGQEYVRRVEAKAMLKIVEEQKQRTEATASEKKDQ